MEEGRAPRQLPRAAEWLRIALWFVACLAVLHPLFFVIYRLSVFNTLPRDDYAPYLLWIAGNPQGAFPDSPYCYRVLSMVAAVPFYWVLPPIRLTNIPADISLDYLRATTALSALAFVSAVGSTLVIYATAVRRCGLDRRDGVVAGGLLLALIWYTQITAIDPLAVLLIAAGVYLLEQPKAFAVLALASIGVNEKVALVLAAWLTIRCVLKRQDRARFSVPCAIAIAAVAAYLAMVALLHFPGNEYQRDMAGFAGTVRQNLGAYLSARGLFLNVVPALVLLIIGLTGHLSCAPTGRRGLFDPTDLLVIGGLLAVALVLTQFFQAGRLAMHAAPLFVIPAAAALGSGRGWTVRAGRPRPDDER
jgi:hypothetical protein